MTIFTTIFTKAGYTKSTKFRVLKEYEGLKVGDIVTMYDDNATHCPIFVSEGGDLGEMYLPDYGDDLEVYTGGDSLNLLKLSTDLNDVLGSHDISLLELTLILNSNNLNQ